MRRALLAAFLSFSFVLPCAAGHVVRSFDFDAPTLAPHGTHAVVTLGDLPCSYEPGQPVLPFRPVRLLVPWGARVRAVAVRVDGAAALPGAADLAVAPQIGPLSLLGRAPGQFRKLYGVAQPAPRRYPEGTWRSRSVQGVYGYAVLDLNLHPVSYDRAARKVTYVRRITVDVEFQERQGPDQLQANLTTDRGQRERVARLVENPEVLASYDGKARPFTDEPCPYLIVTTRALRDLTGPDSLQDFAAFLGARGMRAEFLAVEDVPAGRGDLAARIRDELRLAYQERGTRFVLLAGDADDKAPAVPVRRLWAEFTWEGQQFKQDLPGDVYYACLDGDFNSDGDARYGEPNDGPGGGEVDLYAEVAVGRAPVDNADEVRSFVAKTKKAYAIADAAERRKVLFVGEKLFPGVYGSSYMAEVENGASTHGFTTVGFPETWAKDRLDDVGSQAWTAKQLLAKINAGTYLLTHLGHSAEYMNMRLSSWSLSGLQAQDPFLLYTQGCLCGRFIVDDCIIEKILLAPQGAFACLANSHYGLGPEDPDDDATVKCRGASQYFHRQFFDALFAHDVRQLGPLNQRSKEENIPFMHHGTTRWVYFELNLFGDPALPLVR